MGAILTQIEAAIPELITSLIVAGLTWLAQRAIEWFKNRHQPAAQAIAAPPSTPYAAPPSTPYAAPRPASPMIPAAPAAPVSGAPRIDWGLALLHAGVLQLVVNAESFVLGILLSAVVGSVNFTTVFEVLQLFLGTLAMIAVFAFFGARTARTAMWHHLAAVALLTAPLTLLVNVMLALLLKPAELSQFTFGAIIFAFIQSFVAMGFGGVIAARLRSSKPTSPYAYGAPPTTPTYAPTYTPTYTPTYAPPTPAPRPPTPYGPPAGPAPWPAPPMQAGQPGQPGQPSQAPQQPLFPPPGGQPGPGGYPPRQG